MVVPTEDDRLLGEHPKITAQDRPGSKLIVKLLALAMLLGVGVGFLSLSSQQSDELTAASVVLTSSHKPIPGVRGGDIAPGKTTPDGWPLPLTGKIMATKSAIPMEAGKLKKYSELSHPIMEELAPDEMRLICLGSGNPNIRRAQAAAGWLVQLGNGDNFIFDIGSGTVGNLWSLGFPPAIFDKLFLSHLHLDHVGDIFALYDAMIWGRNRPLNVYGSSGSKPEYGTAHFVDSIVSAASWHLHAKSQVSVSDGMKMNAHEFDYSKFSPDNPRQLIYDDNGVKIYAFPVVHEIQGAVGYRLEWNGRSMTYHGDGTPNTFEADQAAGVDVFIHESFLGPKTMAGIYDIPLSVAKEITSCHTTADRLGKLFEIAKPKLGVGYHYYQDDMTIDPFFKGVASTYKGPVMLAQDFSVINVTPQQIVCRQAQTDLLNEMPKNPDGTKGLHPGVVVDDTPPQWLEDTVIPPS